MKRLVLHKQSSNLPTNRKTECLYFPLKEINGHISQQNAYFPEEVADIPPEELVDADPKEDENEDG